MIRKKSGNGGGASQSSGSAVQADAWVNSGSIGVHRDTGCSAECQAWVALNARGFSSAAQVQQHIAVRDGMIAGAAYNELAGALTFARYVADMEALAGSLKSAVPPSPSGGSSCGVLARVCGAAKSAAEAGIRVVDRCTASTRCTTAVSIGLSVGIGAGCLALGAGVGCGAAAVVIGSAVSFAGNARACPRSKFACAMAGVDLTGAGAGVRQARTASPLLRQGANSGVYRKISEGKVASAMAEATGRWAMRAMASGYWYVDDPSVQVGQLVAGEVAGW